MKKCFNVFLVLTVLVGSVFSAQSIQANETEDEENAIIIEGDANDEEVMKRVQESLNNPEIDSVTVYDSDLVVYPSENTIQTRASGWTVSATCAFPFEQTGTRRIYSVGGPSGTTIKISTTKSVSVSHNGTFGATNSVVTASLGYDITKSISLKLECSAKVPSGKNMRLVALPYEQVSYYTVKYNGQVKGTGTARKPVGITFIKEYY